MYINRLIYISANIDDCEFITCSYNGECVDGNQTYSCICNQGYTGPDCEGNDFFY